MAEDRTLPLLPATTTTPDRQGEILPIVSPPGWPERVDALVLNPPAPDAARSRAFGWGPRGPRADTATPPVALAQIGAVIQSAGYTVDIVDAIGMSMSWEAFERHMWSRRPRYLIIQATASTLTNDMRAALIGKAIGSMTLAFGAHVTPTSRETLDAYPTLDIVVRGEPELTILDVIQTIDRLRGDRSGAMTDQAGMAALTAGRHFSQARLAAHGHFAGVALDTRVRALCAIHGIAFRDEQMHAHITPDRAAIENLDSLPIPLHDRLPWRSYRQPLSGAPYACVQTSRGCPASCHFCLKHATYRAGVRHRSVDHVIKELRMLQDLGIRHIHFDADLFTVKKEFIYELCGAIVKNNIALRWSCYSRVDSVDMAELQIMRQAGCFLIGWAIESGSPAVLRRMRKHSPVARMQETIAASRRAGIKNWGYFQIGLPGETIATIEETIALSKRLPLDRALFQPAKPYPGTPFYDEAMRNGWLTIERWEDYGARTVLSYPHLSAQQIEAWATHASRSWALRPGPLLTFLKDALLDSKRGSSQPAGEATLTWSERNLAKA
jgi:radical SAM superfamily enzyme YgiQ (UPF0313 family)